MRFHYKMVIMRGKNKHILTNVVIVVIYSNLLLFCRKRNICNCIYCIILGLSKGLVMGRSWTSINLKSVNCIWYLYQVNIHSKDWCHTLHGRRAFNRRLVAGDCRRLFRERATAILFINQKEEKNKHEIVFQSCQSSPCFDNKSISTTLYL